MSSNRLKELRQQIKEQRLEQGRQTPWHETVPELLLDKIAELNGILSKYRARHGNNQGMEFYEHLLKVMQVSFDFMKNTRFIHEENQNLRWYNQFLVTHNQVLQERINEIETVNKLAAEDCLDEVFENARVFTEKWLKYRENLKKSQQQMAEKESTAELKPETTND